MPYRRDRMKLVEAMANVFVAPLRNEDIQPGQRQNPLAMCNLVYTQIISPVALKQNRALVG